MLGTAVALRVTDRMQPGTPVTLPGFEARRAVTIEATSSAFADGWRVRNVGDLVVASRRGTLAAAQVEAAVDRARGSADPSMGLTWRAAIGWMSADGVPLGGLFGALLGAAPDGALVTDSTTVCGIGMERDVVGEVRPTDDDVLEIGGLLEELPPTARASAEVVARLGPDAGSAVVVEADPDAAVGLSAFGQSAVADLLADGSHPRHAVARAVAIASLPTERRCEIALRGAVAMSTRGAPMVAIASLLESDVYQRALSGPVDAEIAERAADALVRAATSFYQHGDRASSARLFARGVLVLRLAESGDVAPHIAELAVGAFEQAQAAALRRSFEQHGPRLPTDSGLPWHSPRSMDVLERLAAAIADESDDVDRRRLAAAIAIMRGESSELAVSVPSTGGERIWASLTARQ